MFFKPGQVRQGYLVQLSQCTIYVQQLHCISNTLMHLL